MTLIAIDDNDPSIEYSKSPGWVLVGGNQEFRHTAHYADKPGLQATFTFNGMFHVDGLTENLTF